MRKFKNENLVLAWPKQRNRDRNPFQFLLYKSVEDMALAKVEEFSPTQILSLFRAKILHIHWPDAFLAAGKGFKFWPRYILLRFIFCLAKIFETKIIWTAHNLQRNGQRNEESLNKYFWPWFLKRVDGIIFMTIASKQKAFSRYNFLQKKPIAIIPHGHYVDQVAQCSRINTTKSMKSGILFFGSITRYKNAHKLLDAFLNLPCDSAELRIKGKMSLTEPDTILKEKLEALPLERAKNVIYENAFLTNEALVAEIKASDLVVFPYTDVLNSGAAIYALSVGRPVLASDTSLFNELQSLVGKDWIYLINNELDEIVLFDALTKAKALKALNRTPNLSKLDWSVIAEQTTSFYDQVLASKNNKEGYV
jgi:glycosyltransferase involved in cell wall biosynthesis